MTDNSFSRARALGVLDNRSVVRRDAVGLRDRLDFYKFTLSGSSNVKFRLSGLAANADLILFNSAGRSIGRSRKGGNRVEQINRQLAAGTYYVQVLNRGRGTRYRLTGTATPVGGGGSVGTGTRDNPIDLGILTGGSVGRSRDTAGSFNAERYYKFRLGQISDISIALSQVSGGGNFDLFYDTNRNGQFDPNTDLGVGFGEGTESLNRPISVVLPPAGTFFLRMTRNSSFSTMLYDLTVNTTPVPGNIPTDPGSEPTSAFNLGTLNRGGRLEAKDYVGRLDSNDVYRFTLSETTQVTLNKQDNAGDINVGVTLYQDKNNNNILDVSESLGSLIGSQAAINLQAGTYYVLVSTLNGIAYTVGISA